MVGSRTRDQLWRIQSRRGSVVHRRETLEAAIAAAQQRGKLAVVHVTALEVARDAVEAGADGLVHTFADQLPDAAFGEWGAVRKVFPKTREQRCWVHKTANVLNKLPKGVQPKAKAMLHDIWMAETQAAADQAFDLFVATFAAKFPAATTCLVKDRDVLLTFYAFPAEHWMHIRTTNPVESTFATVRLRTRKTKGAGSRLACLTMVFKLAMAAQKQWRALNGSQLIAEVIDGVPFVDGVRQKAA